ncbi:uncharacterized protein LOC111050493 isoform X1 [Nilaparvata lugens]|uniref:uncharacterized protein LOC111050493 isoform X1 n=2 Tax=Nilaparvata lugens TaxID=108931 RepID=UPI00193CEC93|nr:uncharacterized protein LOC111050493 isoform X1 [Nilaparvata lugens]
MFRYSWLSRVLDIILLVFLEGAIALQIMDLHVPEAIRNGSGAVILDCDYSLSANESKHALQVGLVVKWYLNDHPSPIYQWIPGQKPQELGVMKNRLDLKFKASEQPASKFRAIRIMEPTTELSGEYKCTVSTFDNEDFMMKKMLVYAPEKKLELQHKKSNDGITVHCTAYDVYPQPVLGIFRIENSELKEALPRMSLETVRWHGAFDVSAKASLLEIHGDTMIECELQLPDTNYSSKQRIIYHESGESQLLSNGVKSAITESRHYIGLFIAVVFVTT